MADVADPLKPTTVETQDFFGRPVVVNPIWDGNCRLCGTEFHYDMNNHPMDLGLCYACNDLVAEYELGLL